MNLFINITLYSVDCASLCSTSEFMLLVGLSKEKIGLCIVDCAQIGAQQGRDGRRGQKHGVSKLPGQIKSHSLSYTTLLVIE